MTARARPPLPTLETARLLLRQPTSEDAEAWYSIWGDPAVRWWGEPDASVEASRLGIDELRERMAPFPPGLGWWLVCDRETGEAVGDALLQPLRPAFKHIELGYHLASRHWGKGYATEAAHALIHHGWGTLGLDHLVAAIHVDNHPSMAVARRLGMVRGEAFEHAGLPHHLWRLERPGIV